MTYEEITNMKRKNKLIQSVVALVASIAICVTAVQPLPVEAAPRLDRSGIFDVNYYAENNPDVKAVFGDDKNGMTEHYLKYGIYEGRKGTDKLPDGMITTYTTKYNSKTARATNVVLAAEKVNGTVLQPGEQFSYNNVVGRRTREAGFVEAPVYVSGKESTGIGGGICQVSSTIYAAMLLAGIKADERHKHSLPVHYLPEGMDATVSYGTLDLKFTNPYPFPIIITTYADKGILTINISHADVQQ